MRTVGLTGGVATGKSTVADLLRGHGAYIIDADVVAREVVALGSPLLSDIAKAFAPHQVLTAEGALDRSKVRALVAASREHRATLNALTHPAIRASISSTLAEQRASGTRCCVVEAALMVETGSYRNYDTLVVTTCPDALQLERIMARDGSDLSAAKAWVATQAPQEAKVAVADHVIRTDCAMVVLRESVARLWREVLCA